MVLISTGVNLLELTVQYVVEPLPIKKLEAHGCFILAYMDVVWGCDIANNRPPTNN